MGEGYEFVKKVGRGMDGFEVNLSSNVLTYVVSMELKNAPRSKER